MKTERFCLFYVIVNHTELDSFVNGASWRLENLGCTQNFLAKIDKLRSRNASRRDATLVTVGFSPRNNRYNLPLSL